MMLLSATVSMVVSSLLLCWTGPVLARTVPYFPRYNPWDIGDGGIHAEDNRWLTYDFPEESNPLKNLIRWHDPDVRTFREESLSSEEDVRPSVSVYQKSRGDFVPSSLSLDNVYWWNKRFNQVDIPISDDLPYFDGDDYEAGGVKKRDYTASQLVNMLKALAKARRQRNIRVAGKGLRFGISR